MSRRIPTACFLLVLAVLALAAGCGDDAVVRPDDPYQAVVDQFGLRPLGSIPYPPDNPYHPRRIALGQLLFFDPILGGESGPWVKSAAGKDPYRYRGNDMACGTCHQPSLGFADGRHMGAGVGGGQMDGEAVGPDRVVPGYSLVNGAFPMGLEPRNVPTILNVAFNGKNSPEPTFDSFQLLDGRIEGGLEEQAGEPIANRDEMMGGAFIQRLTEDFDKALPRDSVMARLRDIPGYVERFREAFPGEIAEAADIQLDHFARAISAFERELITPDSRYDRFVAGDRGVLTETEKLGFEVFFGKGLCGDCHSGPMLCDYTFRVQGVGDGYDQEVTFPPFAGRNNLGSDWGRFHADAERFADMKYAFRVLTVRNAELTAPYFHSGSAATLREVVEFYNAGGRRPQDFSDEELAAAGAVRDPSIRPLELTADEIEAVVAFIKTTTAPVRPGPGGLDLTAIPRRVPSGLLPPGIPTPDTPGPYYPEE